MLGFSVLFRSCVGDISVKSGLLLINPWWVCKLRLPEGPSPISAVLGSLAYLPNTKSGALLLPRVRGSRVPLNPKPSPLPLPLPPPPDARLLLEHASRALREDQEAPQWQLKMLIYLSIYLSVCLSVCLSAYIYIYIYTYHISHIYIYIYICIYLCV